MPLMHRCMTVITLKQLDSQRWKRAPRGQANAAQVCPHSVHAGGYHHADFKISARGLRISTLCIQKIEATHVQNLKRTTQKNAGIPEEQAR